MIELNSDTQNDFLSREQVGKLLDAGIDMSESRYIIGKDKLSLNDDEPDHTDYVWLRRTTAEVYDTCPTLTIQELRDKLPEHIYPIIEKEICQADLRLASTHFRFIAFYEMSEKSRKKLLSLGIDDYKKYYYRASCESIIDALASLLLQCGEDI